MSVDILNVGERVLVDNSIVNYEYHSHQPYVTTTFNHNDEIRIPIQTQNLITLPSESFIYIEGKLLNAENKPTKKFNFVNNGVAFLFDEIRYEVGGTIIDRAKNPGITSTMKGYVSYTINESKRLANSGWTLHLQPAKLTDDNGNFNVCIPLRMLLGFAEDFKKVIMNVRQELVLIRSNSDLNAIQAAGAATSGPTESPIITITKILWKIPHVMPSDYAKLQLMRYLEKDIDLDVAFRSWEMHELPLLQETTKHTWAVKTAHQLEKPRYVIVGFQTQSKNNILKNCSQFGHCNLTNIKLYLNSEMYPYDNYNVNMDNKQWAILYEMFTQFQQSYYKYQKNEPCLTPTEFITMAPLIVIDCSRQNEMLKHGAVDVRLEFETSENIPSNTASYCLILHDRLVRYSPLTSAVKIL